MKWEITIKTQGSIIGVLYTWAQTALDAINQIETRVNPNGKYVYCYEARLDNIPSNTRQ